MTTTWVLVGHRTGARILEHGGPGRPLVLVREIEHPSGRRKSGEIDTDRAGISRETGKGRAAAYAKAETAHEHDAAAFARELCRAVERGRTDGRFDALVLVAEPGFLGRINDGLPDECQKLVRGRVSKDLAHVASADLGPFLAGVLAVGDANARMRTS